MLRISARPAFFRRQNQAKTLLLHGILLFACVAAAAGAAAAEVAADRAAGAAIPVLAPLALSGALASTGKDYLTGAQVRIRDFNASAAGRERALKLVAVDNAAIERSQEVLSKAFVDNQNAVAVFMPMQIVSTLELLNSQQLALVAPPGGSFEEHDPSLSPNNFHIRGSWEVEYRKIAEHLSALNIGKVALVYDRILGSRESNSLPLITQIFLKERIGVKPLYFDEGARKSEALLSEIRLYQPQAVILGLAGENILKFLEAYRSDTDGWPLYTTSQGNQTSVRGALKKTGAHLGITQVFPPFWDRTVPLVREYQDSMKRHGYTEYSYHSLEGYIAADVLTSAIQRARVPISRHNIMAAFESLGRMDLGGFAVDFSPGKQGGANYIDLVLIKSDGQYVR